MLSIHACPINSTSHIFQLVQPTELANALRRLTLPVATPIPTRTPTTLFHTLPIDRQLFILHMLQTHESKIPTDIKQTLLLLASSTSPTPIVAQLASLLLLGQEMSSSSEYDTDTIIPPCPLYLFTRTPVFPWSYTLFTEDEYNNSVAVAAAAATTTTTTEQDEQRNGQSTQTLDTAVIEASRNEIELLCNASSSSLLPLTGQKEKEEGGGSALETLLHFLSSSTLSHRHMQGIVEQCNVSALCRPEHDYALFRIITSTLTPTSSAARCAVVARCFLLPAAVALTQPPTQTMSASAHHVAVINSRALVEDCWCPLLLKSPSLSETTATQPFNQHHAEFIIRTLKHQASLPDEAVRMLFHACCQAMTCHQDPSILYIITIMQHLVDAIATASTTSTTTPLPLPNFEEFLDALLQHTHHQSTTSNTKTITGSGKNIKLAKVLLAVVKQYSGKKQPTARTGIPKETIEKAKMVAESIGTFMKKTIIAELDALQQ